MGGLTGARILIVAPGPQVEPPWAVFSLTTPADLLGLFRLDQMLPIQGSHLCRNAINGMGLGGAYERVG